MTDLAGLPKPSAVIFDLDGTLIDTVETRVEAWMEAFREAGIEAERDHVAALIGADGKRLAREVCGRIGLPLDDDRAEKLDRRCGELYDRINTDPKPIHGARTLLDALAASTLRWAIATSSRREQVSGSMAALRLSYEPSITDGSHVEQAKPEPDLLLLAARELRVRPADSWYIGDSTWDMAAARAAGMTAVAVPYGAASPGKLRAAGAHVVTTLRGLTKDLRRRRLID